MDVDEPGGDDRRLCVVGAGVRGTILLDRLRALLDPVGGAPASAAQGLTVDLVDPHRPGPGRIWRTDQSPHLVMNTRADATTVFTGPESTVCGPADPPAPTLYEWARLAAGAPLPEPRRSALAEVADRLDPGCLGTAAPEAAGLRPWDFASRALFGRYLAWALADVIARLPPGVRVAHHARRVVDVRAARGAERARVLLDDGTALPADAVILALGWHLGTSGRGGAGRAGTGRLVPADSPVDQDLDRIAPGAPIALKGLGMSFFDTLILLTQGRGGSFTADGAGGLVYRRGGGEPLVYAGSRRGLPFRAQPELRGPWAGPGLPHTRRAIAALPPAEADLSAAVLPALRRDAALAYYTTLARVSPGAFAEDRGALLGQLAAPDAPDQGALRDAVARAVPRAADRLDLAAAERPVPDVRSLAAYRAWATRYLTDDLREAERGPDSPLKAALACYGAVRPLLPAAAGDGRLTARSYDADLLPFLRLAGAVCGVPPAFRVRQLLALLRADVVRLLPPGMRVETADGRAAVWSDAVPGSRVAVDAVVEAHLPPPGLGGGTGTPLDALCARGEARPHRVGGLARPGLDVAAATGAVVRADGSPHRRLFAVGLPVESLRIFTIVAPVARTDSAVLREADACARAALTRCRSGAGGLGNSRALPAT
ncbi:FAD/NAD(P)-binding domain-containing protein [Streptomyces sp. PT12]|uniref:FAD/NAD(P)-binding protein n=1 Tax=Streptomyces sp. PT12 TaxID=1510197 RepID=UPI0015EE9B4D|nr:FAD/NAD(P)-binding protein [Streptomyces sp. PT12]